VEILVRKEPQRRDNMDKTKLEELKTNGIKIGGTLRSGTVKVLFKHLATDVALHSSGPPFVSSNTISFSGDLTIELEGQQTSNVNTVTVRPTGEISGN